MHIHIHACIIPLCRSTRTYYTHKYVQTYTQNTHRNTYVYVHTYKIHLRRSTISLRRCDGKLSIEGNVCRLLAIMSMHNSINEGTLLLSSSFSSITSGICKCVVVRVCEYMHIHTYIQHIVYTYPYIHTRTHTHTHLRLCGPWAHHAPRRVVFVRLPDWRRRRHRCLHCRLPVHR